MFHECNDEGDDNNTDYYLLITFYIPREAGTSLHTQLLFTDALR